MISLARIGILGGTFDPIHVGHIETAAAAQQGLALERVVFIPSRVPPHRQVGPEASPYHRFAMTALAINALDGFEVSDMELAAPGTSYTADTLGRLHATGLVAAQIFFITGADAFAEIETWRQYPRVLDMAHFVVVPRPGHEVGALPALLPALAGRMVRASPDAALPGTPSIFLVNAPTPDVSSTAIRRRLRRRESVRGLVPAAVEIHIRQHGLYQRTGGSDDYPITADHLHGQN